MNEKQRLMNALTGVPVDRPPVICPGGMMNASVTELLGDVEKNHNADVNTMVEVARRVHDLTGFENYGVPFCMTVESEPLGAKIDLGDKRIEPKVQEYNQAALEAIMEKCVAPIQSKRMQVTLEAIRCLKNEDIPVIGNITGHISTATSAVDPLDILKMLRRDPDRVYRFFEFIGNYSKAYAIEMIKGGADVIAVSDPTATGEILGARNFERFAVPLYNEIIDVVHSFGVPVIIHICGNANTIVDSLNLVKADAVSFDSVVSLKSVKARLKAKLMGNVNTQLLHTGEKSKIEAATRHCLESGTDILSPACGLSMATPVENLRSMTEYVKKGCR